MRLTQWTDYSLRVLMYCAACRERAQPVTITEIAEFHGISRSHLTKVVMTLSSLGYLATTRGRGGGMRLSKRPDQITVGEVVRQTEADITLVECFDAATNTCRLAGHCRLEAGLKRATARFLEELDGMTLADVVPPAAAGGSPGPPVERPLVLRRGRG